jgi:SAM-dependent methyltransferase
MMRETSAPADTSQQTNVMRQVLLGFMATRALEMATRLDIPDLLDNTPLTADAIAEAIGGDALSVSRLMQCLETVGVFSRDPEGRFGLTPLSQLLLKDHPASLRPAVLYFSAPFIQDAWGNIGHSIKTGDAAFDKTHGTSYWSYLDANPDDAMNFNQFLATVRPHRHAAVVKAYDFASVGTVVDVGGGYGQLLAHILAANPEAKGILFDAPALEADAFDFLTAEGVADRGEFVGGDFFSEVPAGGDVYVLGDVIHDWSDADSVKILSTCRRAMGPTSRLLLVEQLMSPEAVWVDLHMMVLFGEARQRSEDEFRTILEQAGLRLERVIPTASEASVIAAVPV